VKVEIQVPERHPKLQVTLRKEMRRGAIAEDKMAEKDLKKGKKIKDHRRGLL
jgi:hypothetical protein